MKPRAIALWFLLACPLFAQVAPTTVSDYAFQPSADEGYIQAWNAEFRGQGTYLYVTFVISNTGPGTWNNGVSILALKDGKNRVWTAEYSVRSLKATPGQFGHKSGLSQIGYNEKGHLVVHAVVPGGGASPPESMSIDLVIEPASPGVRISGGPLQPVPGSFLRADIPVTSGRATAVVKIGGEEFKLSGGESIEQMTSLAKYVDLRFEQLKKECPTLAKNRMFVLVALTIADELQALRREYDDLINMIEKEVN